jgi:hypothetical protein
VLLAELEVWHSRPVTPTRRVALGNLVLPVDPAPGFGGLLLGAVVARFVPEVDDDLLPDVHRLLDQIDRGDRIVQPRLRHRYQVDRHGLAVSTHRLEGEGDSVRFDLQAFGSPLVQVLGAMYAIERLDLVHRHQLVPVVRRAMRWRGPIGPAFVTNLAGGVGASLAAMADPRAWALDLLGFPPGTTQVTKKEVTARYREALRAAHPDHGGDEDEAASSIAELADARRILTAGVAATGPAATRAAG